MARKEKRVLKEGVITNNCPECYNQDMLLTFYQKHLFSKFYHKTTKEVTYQIRCNKCDSIIYPVNWTDDIERSFEYFQKTVAPKKAGLRFTGLFYGLVLFLIALIGTGIYLYQSGLIQL